MPLRFLQERTDHEQGDEHHQSPAVYCGGENEDADQEPDDERIDQRRWLVLLGEFEQFGVGELCEVVGIHHPLTASTTSSMP